MSIFMVGGSALIAHDDVKQEARELFDAQLARSARLLLSLVQTYNASVDFPNLQTHLNENQLILDTPEHLEEGAELESGHIYETKLAFQIWGNNSNLLLRSISAPIQPITLQKNGYSYQTINGQQWRVFSLPSKDGRYLCLTAERLDVRNDLIDKISSDLFILFVVLIPVLSIIMWFALSQGLRPLQKLASQIHRRGAEKLDSVSEKNAPSEISTIANAINKLLARLKEALDREKRITSDAAHELKTPLAAVRLHAELAQKATNKNDRIESINQVINGIDRTTHLVEQLLTLARLEPESLNLNFETLDLKQITIEETALLTPLAFRKNIDLSVSENTEAFFVKAEDVSLRLLIRNLLNNAISYTQEGGKVTLTLSSSNNSTCLTIEDNGPGIPLDDRKRVLERFYRVHSHETPGCGIGLSIVTRVVELYNATLEMNEPETGTGLVVTVCIPVE